MYASNQRAKMKQLSASNSLYLHPGTIEMLRRKPVGNPDDFFSKTFAEYKAGFSSKGDIMYYVLCIK